MLELLGHWPALLLSLCGGCLEACLLPLLPSMVLLLLLLPISAALLLLLCWLLPGFMPELLLTSLCGGCFEA